MIIRDEQPKDFAAIRTVISAAFKDIPHSSQTEAAIVEALRAANVLTISLVAMNRDDLVGHIAFSPVTIDGQNLDWYGLGPVAVRPHRQGQAIGATLIRAGLERLKALGAKGCVLLGEPNYYSRFGFRVYPGLRLLDVPPEYFMAVAFTAETPRGWVRYHEGFDAHD
jgi:putative acetyltransferase